jgi:sugar lactone lactonase YvrE
MKISYHLSLFAGLALSSAAAFGKGIPNNAAADLVLGQANFTSALGPNPPNAKSLRFPLGFTTDANTGKVFVADTDNNRVLRYSSATALANGAAAELVFGSLFFSDPASDTGQRFFRSPTGLFVDRMGRLWVADAANHRVLSFDAASFITTNGPNAIKVFGQANFSTRIPDSPLNRMNNPNGVWVDSSDRLWVADTGNKRVLRFDAVSGKANGAAADGSLGLSFASPDFRTDEPVSLSVSSNGALFVVDTLKHRVLRYDNAAALPATSAPSAVLGQSSLSGAAPATTATGMINPRGAFITPDDTLWVTDAGNNRITRFNNASTKPNGAAADGIIGQATFTTNTQGTTDRTFKFPGFQSVVDASGNLWVPDPQNNRILRFPADSTVPTLALTGKAPKSTKKKAITLNGTASDANGISLVQFKIGNGPLKSATGTTTWQIKSKLKKGKNTITVFATDSVGNVSVNKIIKIKRK